MATTRSPWRRAFAGRGRPVDPCRRPGRGPDRRAGQPPGGRARSRPRSAGWGVRVQAGGGVRDVDDADELLTAGVARVVVGTAAVERPGPGRPRSPPAGPGGWRSASTTAAVRCGCGAGRRAAAGRSPISCRRRSAAGAAAVIVTDIARDGRLAGPDVDGLADLLAAHRARRSSPRAGSGTSRTSGPWPGSDPGGRGWPGSSRARPSTRAPWTSAAALAECAAAAG